MSTMLTLYFISWLTALHRSRPAECGMSKSISRANACEWRRHAKTKAGPIPTPEEQQGKENILPHTAYIAYMLYILYRLIFGYNI